MEEQECVALVNFLKLETFPVSMQGSDRTNVNRRNHYNTKAKHFFLKDDDLYKVVPGVLSGVKVVSVGETKAVLKEFHSNGIGGHSGFNKTNDAIKIRYWLPKMTSDVRKCIQCQKSDLIKPPKKPELKSINVTQPFELVGCDLMGLFAETPAGNKYKFTATDYYRKWVEAFPIPDKSAQQVSKCIKKLIYRHGAMNAILTDQSREFINQINQELCSTLGIKHKVIAAYHPQTNGLDDRTNQTIKRALSKLVNEVQNDWDERLDEVLFSIWTKKQSSTKFSPFFLLYGRAAVYPSQLQTVALDDIIGVLPDRDMIEKQSSVQKEQTETTGLVVLDNTSKPKKATERFH